MTRLRIEDLPPAVRRKIAEGSSRAPTQPEAPVGKPAPPSAPSRYLCGTCQLEVVGFEPAQRHANEAHHGARLELLPVQGKAGYGDAAQPR